MHKPFNESSVSCSDVLQFICEQFGDEDDSERCKQVKRHLENCPDCTHYCNSLETMIGLYRVSSPQFTADARKVLLHTLGLEPEGNPESK